jgi:hypothetical protein
MLLGSFLVASLNSPVYLSIPVQDEKVVDRFLEGLEGLFAVMARQPASGGWFSFEQDFYQLKGNKGQVIRCNGLKFGPVRFRIFWARIGKGLYIASKPYILDDLLAADKGEAAADRGPPAHAMVRMRPENWDQVLTDFRLGWAENNRQACLNNLGPLASVGRAVNASFATDVKDDAEAAVKRAAEIHRQADRLHGVHFFCPEGGQYVLGPNGKVMACSVHGWARAPRQAAAPTESAALGKLLRQFAGMTTTLTFLEDGLHAVVTIDRK